MLVAFPAGIFSDAPSEPMATTASEAADRIIGGVLEFGAGFEIGLGIGLGAGTGAGLGTGAEGAAGIGAIGRVLKQAAGIRLLIKYGLLASLSTLVTVFTSNTLLLPPPVLRINPETITVWSL